ncbi:transposase [Bordetella pertussis]|nr:transposase [Bordetella pertussis]
MAIDDHARVAFTDIHPDERFPSAVQFLKDAVAYYQRLGVTIQRLLTEAQWLGLSQPRLRRAVP